VIEFPFQPFVCIVRANLKSQQSKTRSILPLPATRCHSAVGWITYCFPEFLGTPCVLVAFCNGMGMAPATRINRPRMQEILAAHISFAPG
jgi:hypothetical protein